MTRTQDRPRYLPDLAALDRLRAFVGSRRRVFVLSGSPGSGKSTLALRLYEHLADIADVQVHLAGGWTKAADGPEIAILRYAGLADDRDAPSRLEDAAGRLQRPCLVVVDGITSQDDLDRSVDSVDRVLHQVLCDHLRFVLLVRSPPELRVARAPLVTATLHDDPAGTGPSHRLTPWSPSTAATVWNDSPDEVIPFRLLPPAVQDIARTPLYMRLLQSADIGQFGHADVFGLLDFCVRGALQNHGGDPFRVRRDLVSLARRRIPGLE